MGRGRKDPLRELLNRKLEAAAAGEPSTEEMEGITRLAKFIDLRDSLRPKRRNWWPVAVLGFSLAVVSVLLFARVTETQIELEAASTDLTFSTPREQLVTSALDLVALGASGLRSAELPGGAGDAAAVSLAGDSAKGRKGSVTVAPLLLPVSTRMTLRRSDVANQYRVLLTGSGVVVQGALIGPIRVGRAGSPAQEFDLLSPKPFSLSGGTEEIALDLTFPALPQTPVTNQLAVSDISASRIDRFLGAGRTIVTRLSTIASGTLFFESLHGEERKLRSGEELQFERIGGEFRTVELGASQIAWKFHGKVRGMTTGSGEGRHSLMPTCLDWLRARHGLTLFWATSLYVFGLLAGALRWWGVRI